jgi:hypothetical protein
MDASSVILMHGSARKGKTNMPYREKYDPAIGMYVRSKIKTRKKRGFHGFGELGKIDIRGTFDSVKEVLQTGVIAVVGSIVTDKVWNMVGKTLNLSETSKALANILTGTLLGIIVGKVTKRAKLGVAFAIGPVVVGMLNLFGQFMTKVPSTAGLTQVTFPGQFQRALPLPQNMMTSGITTARRVARMDMAA